VTRGRIPRKSPWRPSSSHSPRSSAPLSPARKRSRLSGALNFVLGMCRLAATTISGNKIATEFRVGTYVPAGETYKAGNVMTANFSVTLPIGTPLPPYSDPVMSTTSEVMRTLTRGTVYQNAQSQWVIPYTFRYSRSADFSGGTSGACSAIVLAWTGASNNGSKMPVGSVLTLDPPARGSGSYVLNAAHTTYYP